MLSNFFCENTHSISRIPIIVSKEEKFHQSDVVVKIGCDYLTVDDINCLLSTKWLNDKVSLEDADGTLI